MLHELFEEKSDSKHQFGKSSDIGAWTRTNVLPDCSVASISQDTLSLDAKLTLRGIEKNNNHKQADESRASQPLFVFFLSSPAMLKQWSISEKRFWRLNWRALLVEKFEFSSHIWEHGPVWSHHAYQCVWNSSKRMKQVFRVINPTVTFVNSVRLWCLYVQNLEEGLFLCSCSQMSGKSYIFPWYHSYSSQPTENEETFIHLIEKATNYFSIFHQRELFLSR